MRIDHLVFAAADLAVGRDWMTERLGVAPGGAGVHPLMGTHNALWSLGTCYLEVIAVDPDAVAQRRRWFGLDGPEVRESLAAGPRLLTWVARVDDLDAALMATPLPLGEAVEVTRTGLRWRLSVRPDGALVEEGRAPVLIEWPRDVVTPERSLPDSGLRLDSLRVGGASKALAALIGGMERVTCTGGDGLAATLRRPDGQRVDFQ